MKSTPLLSQLARYWPIALAFVGMTVLQALVAIFSIQLLSSVRAYVTGESLYSKGQKDAQIYLLDYAERHREDDYRRFMQSLAVPLGDRAAREALLQEPPDLARARQGFLDGGNHPDDVAGLIRLFRWFHRVSFMSEPIATWTEGDRVIEAMRVLVDTARTQILAGNANSAAVQEMRAQAPVLNRRLTELESQFSAQLGEASRTMQVLLIGLNASIALLLTAAGLLLVYRSAREQALTEREKHAREALEASNRAKTEFLSRMSHELRTPLNAVIGFAQLLRTDSTRSLTPQQLERTQHIETAGAHLLALVNDVLDLSLVEAGRMVVQSEPVAVSLIVEEATTMVSPLVTKAGVEMLIEAAPEEIWVSADHVRLRQVLVNLLSNAVKYNRSGGSVSLSWTADPTTCVISIADTGQGIAPEKLCRLFESFNRLGAEASHVEGTGIGLVLSRRLTEMMQGTLDISSVLGQGTTARLTLHRAGAPDATPRFAPSTVRGNSVGGMLEVLYAEDNEVNAELVRQIMKLRPSVALRIAESGAAALEMVRLYPPDLMLVDMHLGDMTGIELACTIRQSERSRDIRLVALSADALPEQISAAMACGFDGYLTKPVNFKELLALVDAHIEAL